MLSDWYSPSCSVSCGFGYFFPLALGLGVPWIGLRNLWHLTRHPAASDWSVGSLAIYLLIANVSTGCQLERRTVGFSCAALIRNGLSLAFHSWNL